MPRRLPTCSIWCGAGTASDARCSRLCTTSISCGRTFRRRCSWRASRSPGAARRACSRRKTCSPGAAVGFLLSGLNLFAMTAGGLIAGFVVALLTGLVARTTELKEDAALATFYLLSLAIGVTIISLQGTNIDLLHILFGNVLALDDQTLLLIASNATITLIVLALIYRPLVIECVDPGFMRTVSRAGGPAHLAFLVLVVVNLVSGFHALGTLLAVGIMMLPAAIGRFWARDITLMILIATASGLVAGYAGLLVSFHFGVASGPAVILVAGALYVVSPLFRHLRGPGRQP